MERLQKVLEEHIDGVHEQNVKIQALRFEKGDDPDEVRKWTLEIEEQLAEFQEIKGKMREEVRNQREEALQ